MTIPAKPAPVVWQDNWPRCYLRQVQGEYVVGPMSDPYVCRGCIDCQPQKFDRPRAWSAGFGRKA